MCLLPVLSTAQYWKQTSSVMVSRKASSVYAVFWLMVSGVTVLMLMTGLGVSTWSPDHSVVVKAAVSADPTVCSVSCRRLGWSTVVCYCRSAARRAANLWSRVWLPCLHTPAFSHSSHHSLQCMSNLFLFFISLPRIAMQNVFCKSSASPVLFHWNLHSTPL